MLVLLSAIKSHPVLSSNIPNLVLVSSNGLSKTSHESLPLVWKPLYKYALASAHADKLGLERVAGHAAGFLWPEEDEQPDSSVLPSGWEERAGDQGWMKGKIAIVRPSLLTNGVCKAEAKPEAYRTSTGDLKSAYTISRSNTAHCIVEKILADWGTWGGKILRVTY